MNAKLEPKTAAPGNVANITNRLAFAKKLQALTNRIHSTANIDEIIVELSRDICALFEADRLTIYTVTPDTQFVVSKVKTGLDSFRELKLPINETSIAGYCAVHQTVMNIADVYNDEELRKYAPPLTFLKAVDKRTGYRTKQMLVAPVMGGEDGKEMLGVLQLINARDDQTFSQVTEEGVAELAKTLAVAFRVRQQTPAHIVKSRFDYLVLDKIISAPELELAHRTARRKEKSIEEVLTEEFHVTNTALGESLGKYYSVDYEPFRDRMKPMDLLKNLKRDYVVSSLWVPIDDSKEGLVVLTPDPERIRGTRVVENIFPKHKIIFKVTTQQEFLKTVNLFYGDPVSGGSIGELLSGMDQDDGQDGSALYAEEISAAADNEVVKLVNKIIIDAYHQGVSDIHVEPYPGKNRTEIRFRRDGTLVPYTEVPASYRNALVTRIKIMCDLDISEKRKPQDGKIMFKKYGPLDIELRVATLPSAGGVEDVVMRILAAGEPIPLDKLGVLPRNLKILKEQITKPYGIFFACGPTGSGKTTTLHSILGYINTPESKIWTAEDPVEITQKGLRQVQVNPKAGLTFAMAMRAFLRADPDVIMVGEMRDKETVHMGLEASLTGHMVFSTLHTNSAPESIIRLLDMGMDPFNFADALVGILAQRLAKRLCGKCKVPYSATQAEIKQLLHEYGAELANTPEWKADMQGAYKKQHDEWVKDYANEKGEFTLYKPKGCETCNSTGYKGRVGLHELLVGTDAMKKNIQEHARVSEMVATALSEGMRTLRQDGIEKVLQGITDMVQVRAVCIK
jgi:type II secretory ATPase GspE/PulE/Tfp pilus assembly ATPase PilB-like protein